MAEQTAALIKSIIVSKSGGVPLEKLDDEFRKIVGEPIPYLRLGFHCLRDLLNNVEGLKNTLNDHGERVLVVTGPKIKHIESLIQRQKREFFKHKNKRYKRFTPYGQDYKNRARSWRNGVRSINRQGEIDKHRQQDLFGDESQRYGRPYCNNTSSFEDEEENRRPVIIESDSTEETDVIYDPIAYGRQLIGDDFFLQLTIRNLHQPIWRDTSSMALHCGLCKSGQTIRNCIRTLLNVNCISNRLVIMLGAVDVYNCASPDEMIEDMTELLDILHEKFLFSNSAITLCTIPPLANISVLSHHQKATTLLVFNNWIRSLSRQHGTSNSWTSNSSLINDYQVVDFFELFTHENYATQYDWFQYNARMVSGCRHPHVLWNKKGRKRAMEALMSAC